ncbi:MAG: isochorismate synthase, partial [Cyanobacteria bacterium CRU_2_1]|nr:isochorismate synthase [Cyanobacteria bacterium CRU_2_1]
FFASFTFFDQHLEPDPPFPTATIFLPRWQVSRWQDHNVAVVNLVVEPESNVESLAEKTCQEFQQISSVQYNFFRLPSGLSNLLNSWEIIDTHNFQSAVISALDSIEKHYFKKLVLAHTIDVISHLPFQWGHSLHNLRQIHPDCYVFSAGNGKGQNFIGASPERLLSIQNRQLVTDALAGSAPRGRSLTEDAKFAQQLLRSRKERWEHRVVVDFITQQLVNLGLNPQYTDTPGLVKLSNIQHLHTPIQATLPAHLHPLDILAELHPTPAVAGMPRTIACEQIRQHEPFGRSLYAAPLGWIDTQGNAEFIVGIRSALIEGHRARLYAGAGIVAGSNPEREQAEVQLKLQALLRALV